MKAVWRLAHVIKSLKKFIGEIFNCHIYLPMYLCLLLAINACPFSSSRVIDGSAQVWNAQLPHCVRVHGTAGLTRAFPVHGTERSQASTSPNFFPPSLSLHYLPIFLFSGLLNRWILREYHFLVPFLCKIIPTKWKREEFQRSKEKDI